MRTKLQNLHLLGPKRLEQVTFKNDSGRAGMTDIVLGVAAGLSLRFYCSSALK